MRSKLGLIFLLVCMVASCGKKDNPAPNHTFGPDTFAPTDNVVIPPKFVRLTDFVVQDMPDYDAHLEIGVEGIGASDGSIQCVVVTQHKRFRTDRAWGTFPIALYSQNYSAPDGSEDLNPLFQQTLTFANESVTPTMLSVTVTFTRGKAFTADWQLYPLLTTDSSGNPACTGVGAAKKNSQVLSHGDRAAIHTITAVVDKLRDLFQQGLPPSQVDDLSALILALEDVDSSGKPNGTQYSVNVPGFQ